MTCLVSCVAVVSSVVLNRSVPHIVRDQMVLSYQRSREGISLGGGQILINGNLLLSLQLLFCKLNPNGQPPTHPADVEAQKPHNATKTLHYCSFRI